MSISLASVVQVIGWINDYQATLPDLGKEEEDTRFPTKEQSGMSPITTHVTKGCQLCAGDQVDQRLPGHPAGPGH